MALSTPVKALALVIFIAAIASATYGVQTMLGDSVTAQVVSLSAPREVLNATPGHNVTYVVSVSNRDVASRDVVLVASGGATGRSEPTTVRGGSNASVFLTVEVPADAAPGEHAIDVRAEGGDELLRQREGFLRVRVLEPAPGFEAGDVADVVYTGRLSATGRVFNTNDRALVGLPIPKTDTYRFNDGLLRIQTVPRPSVVPGLYEGMLGMQAGESRTVSMPPEKAYGPSTDEIVYPRLDVVPRNITLVNDLQRVPRETFDTYVAESRQGTPDSFDVGSIFRLEQNGNMWPYRIVAKTPTHVDYRLAAEPGDVFTVYPFWPNASEVVAIDDSSVVFRTTPTTQPGQNFTYRQSWPEMTTLAEAYNETHFKLIHTPPVGFSYTHVTETGQPREATVREVSNERIVIALPSQNPLAGKDLTFDVTLVTLTKGSG